jgi:hypothetical protein
VLAAVDGGHLPAERLEHWRQLQRELAYLARRQDKLAEAEERARTRAIHRSARKWIRDKYK